MPRDCHWVPEEGPFPYPRETNLLYPADQPGWCELIARDEPAPPRPSARARRLLVEDDLLGRCMLLLMAPGFLTAAGCILYQALPAL